jgi:hypothetical protein
MVIGVVVHTSLRSPFVGLTTGEQSHQHLHMKKNGGQTVVLLLACLIQSFLRKCHGLLTEWEGIDKAEMDGKLFLC